MNLPRRVAPETLDALAPEDAAARASRRDLRRIHRVMGTRSILRARLRDWCSGGRANAPLRVLEIGAGDGTLMLGVARDMQAAAAGAIELTLLDRQDLVEPSTVAAYTAQGWRALPRVVDVLDWATGSPGAREVCKRARPASPAPAPAAEHWDIVVANLFVHHFEGEALRVLMAAIAARTDRFLACEPRRSRAALLASHLVGALGANAVTREDAVLSVHAGFRDDELSSAWPGAPSEWACDERGAGLFSHTFAAWRRAPPGRLLDVASPARGIEA